MTAPAATSASTGPLGRPRSARGGRGLDGGALALLARQQSSARCGRSASGQQDDADDRAGEHDQAGGDAGAAHERDAGDQQAGDRDQHDARRGEGGVAGGRVGALARPRPASGRRAVRPAGARRSAARSRYRRRGRACRPASARGRARRWRRRPRSARRSRSRCRRTQRTARCPPRAGCAARRSGAGPRSRARSPRRSGTRRWRRRRSARRTWRRQPRAAGGRVLEPFARRRVEVGRGLVVADGGVGDRGRRRTPGAEGSSTETTCGWRSILRAPRRVDRGAGALGR